MGAPEAARIDVIPRATTSEMSREKGDIEPVRQIAVRWLSPRCPEVVIVGTDLCAPIWRLLSFVLPKDSVVPYGNMGNNKGASRP